MDIGLVPARQALGGAGVEFRHGGCAAIHHSCRNDRQQRRRRRAVDYVGQMVAIPVNHIAP